MIRYICDWCGREFGPEEISTVRVDNVFNEAAVVNICWACGKVHMPAGLQPLISWTAPRDQDLADRPPGEEVP